VPFYVAMLVPAHRATRLDPVVAFRADRPARPASPEALLACGASICLHMGSFAPVRTFRNVPGQDAAGGVAPPACRAW
jgi:hypothetical protein